MTPRIEIYCPPLHVPIRPGPLTDEQLQYLKGMALCHRSNTGKLPTSAEQLLDHWCEIGSQLQLLDPPETVAETDKHHYPELIWLAELAERPDADQLLAAAIELADEPVPNPPAGFATARWRRDADVAEIVRCILAALKYEPHTADLTRLRQALEAQTPPEAL